MSNTFSRFSGTALWTVKTCNYTILCLDSLKVWAVGFPRFNFGIGTRWCGG